AVDDGRIIVSEACDILVKGNT
nr:hypothetical protein [Tanacetum cinerariifolium]